MEQTPRVILLIDAARAYERGIIRGVQRYARLHGPWTLLRKTPVPSGGMARLSMQDLQSWQADGILWRESRPDLRVEQLGIPTVYAPITALSDTMPNIRTDDRAIGRMAAEHLLGLGLRHFAFFGLGDRYYWSAGRQAGFLERAREAEGSIEVFTQADAPDGSDRRNRHKDLRKWLAARPRPFGLMLCTDDCCLDCFEACHEAGLRIPEDACVVGVGNDGLTCDFVHPPLSSIALDIEQAGYAAAETLAKMMKKKSRAKPRDITVHPLQVFQRRSTDSLAFEDRLVARAVEYIRNHALQNLHVDDVLKAVPLSRRDLYRRFEKEVGRPIYGEIRRVRAERAARMLRETNLPITRIAQELGYGDAKNFSRMFVREKKTTPLKYRRQFS